MNFRPQQIYYLISLKCNQRCSKCRHWQKPQDDAILDPNLISSALLSLVPIQEFCIVGGEPLIHAESVLRILEATKRLDHRNVIVTNGVLLMPGLVDELRNYNIHLVVSIDTTDRHFWKYVRGIDSFDMVMNNLDYACGVLTSEQLSIQSVKAVETIAHLDDVRSFCQDRGLYHSVQEYVQDGFDGEWTPCDVCSTFGEAVKSAQSCYAAGRNLSIDPHGNVNTCFQQYLIPGCATPLGNLKDNSVDEILSSDYSSKVQMAMKGCKLPCRVLKCNQEN